METSRTRTHPFWVGVTQHALGALIALVIAAVGSALIGYSRAILMHQTLTTAFYVFVFVMGVCLVLAGLFLGGVWIQAKFSGDQRLAPDSQNAPTTPQKLTIRIDKAYCGERTSKPYLAVILLDVKVDGPPSTIKKWELKLTLGDEPLSPLCEPIREAVAFRPENQDATYEPIIAEQIPEMVPARGWLQFTGLLDKELRERHIFAATFTLIASDEDCSQSTAVIQPGTWLHRAMISS